MASWITVVLCLLLAVNAHAASAENVKNKASETVEAAGEYTKEQKDAFVADMNQKMADLKKEIKDLKASASKEKETQIKKLEDKQDRLEKDISKLKKSSGQAWVKMKNGITNAWGTLTDSFSEAKKEITK